MQVQWDELHANARTHAHTETNVREKQRESEKGKVEMSVRTMKCCLLFCKTDTIVCHGVFRLTESSWIAARTGTMESRTACTFDCALIFRFYFLVSARSSLRVCLDVFVSNGCILMLVKSGPSFSSLSLCAVSSVNSHGGEKKRAF